jgi:hypothetical protein
VILTNDVWKIVVNLDLIPYEEALINFRGDLHHILKFKSQFAPTNELVQTENLLNGLEQGIEAFKSILPRMDDRQALLNVAGSFFKILFGTATVMDLEKLHNSVEELHERQEKLVHDVDNRMTYSKTLDASVKFNMQAISALSEKV